MKESPILNPESEEKSSDEKLQEKPIREGEIDVRQLTLDVELAARGITNAEDKEKWMQLNNEEYEKLSEDLYEERITLEEFQEKLHKLINPPSV